MTTRRTLGRRGALGAVLSGALWGCRGKAERCAYCGMTIDPTSPWRADLVLAGGGATHYDTPRCAFTAWRKGQISAIGIRVQDYYDRRWRDGQEVLFAVGSDVIGPMGPDLVPVDLARASKFAEEHTAARPLPADAVTLELLTELR